MRASRHRALLAATPLVVLALVAATLDAGAAPPKKADLKITATRTVAFTAEAGAPVRVVATVKNLGTKRAAPTSAGLYLSRDAKVGDTDRRLDTSATPVLDPGRAAAVTLSGALPRPIAAGGWRLLVCADIGGKVPERSSANNCAVWRTFTITDTPPPVVEQGPLGGSKGGICGGAVRPLMNQTTAPSGVHFSIVSPVSDTVTVPHTADGVGFEARESNEEYAHTVVTIVNDGTAPATGMGVDVRSCEYDREKPGYWGILKEDQDAVGVNDDCKGTLQVNETCQISFFADSVRRGGNNLAGGVSITGQLPGQDGDFWATFPVRGSASSRGYFEYDVAQSDPFTNQNPHLIRYAYIDLVNIGDRAGVPTLDLEPAAGTATGVFRQSPPGGGWSSVGGTPKCAPAFDAANQVWLGGIGPGDRCQVRVAACSGTSSAVHEATLTARLPFGSTEAYSAPFELFYSTAVGGSGSCPS